MAAEKKRLIPSATRDLKVPLREPIFVLRGQDAYTLTTIRAYIQVCVNAGNESQARAAEDALREIENWQSANHTKVKAPDSPPTEEPVGVPPAEDE